MWQEYGMEKSYSPAERTLNKSLKSKIRPAVCAGGYVCRAWSRWVVVWAGGGKRASVFHGLSMPYPRAERGP